MGNMASNFAKNQIARLIGEFTQTIRDPLWRDIPLSEGFKRLFISKPMQKLGRIKQLGPAHLLYPGAVHTRLDHSLGVFHATRLIMLALLTAQTRSDTPSPKLSQEGLQALLAAAMLHDLGHFPYAHALKDNISREHEALGSEIIEHDPTLKDIITTHLKTSVASVCQIIDPHLPCQDEEILFYRTLLSGTLDPDKLDYLSRDALFCGIPYGMQDASYIIRHLHVNEENTLCIPFEAIGAVEHLLFAKYSMYRNVYWHQTTRSATAMIKKAVFLALQEEVCTESELYGLDDESFWVLFSRMQHEGVVQLVQRVRHNDLLVSRTMLSFEQSNQHQKLFLNQSSRNVTESVIWGKLSRRYTSLKPYEVIIDVPEDISFESDFPILLENNTTQPFYAVDELFTKPMVQTFTSSLRKIRLFLPPYIEPPHVLEALPEELRSNA